MTPLLLYLLLVTSLVVEFVQYPTGCSLAPRSRFLADRRFEPPSRFQPKCVGADGVGTWRSIVPRIGSQVFEFSSNGYTFGVERAWRSIPSAGWCVSAASMLGS